MAELVFSPALWWGLGAGAALFAALTVFCKRRSPLWAALACACMAGGVLLTLLQGRGLLLKKGTSMDSTLIPVPSSTNELLTGVEDASPDSGSSPAPKFGSCLAPQSS